MPQYGLTEKCLDVDTYSTSAGSFKFSRGPSEEFLAWAKEHNCEVGNDRGWLIDIPDDLTAVEFLLTWS
jgi:hypothetical protein